MKKLFAFSFLVLCFSAVSRTAHADTLTYNLQLTPDAGSAGQTAGTGSFTIMTDPTQVSSSFTTYSVADGSLLALTFVINGKTYDIAGKPGDPSASVSFYAGDFNSIFFNESVCVSRTPGGRCTDSASLSGQQKNNAYTFTPGATAADSDPTTGTFSASLAPTATATPEPSSLMLLGTGALGVAGAARRRLKRA